MLALTTPIKERLAALPAFVGWAVRTGTDNTDRRIVPAVDVRCGGAGVSSKTKGMAMVAPEWTVTLITRRADDAAEMLDAAFAAVVASLHSWQPGSVGGRGWESLDLVRVTEPDFVDEGLVGSSLVFSTSAMYRGQS